MSVFRRAALVTALLFVVACRPSIGDRCTLSTDCSSQGDRVCDTAQYGGYCTVLNCTSNSCPDKGVCVRFQPSVPGCSYDDYAAPGRTSQALCMAHCSGDSDCRRSDGYVCADPRTAPWYAAVLDSNQSERVCITAASQRSVDNAEAGVCSPSAEAGSDGESSFDGGDGGDSDARPDADAGASEAAADGGPGSDAGPPSDVATPDDATIPSTTPEGGDASLDGPGMGDASLDADGGIPDATSDGASETGDASDGDATAGDATADDAPDGG